MNKRWYLETNLTVAMLSGIAVIVVWRNGILLVIYLIVVPILMYLIGRLLEKLMKPDKHTDKTEPKSEDLIAQFEAKCPNYYFGSSSAYLAPLIVPSLFGNFDPWGYVGLEAFAKNCPRISIHLKSSKFHDYVGYIDLKSKTVLISNMFSALKTDFDPLLEMGFTISVM